MVSDSSIVLLNGLMSLKGIAASETCLSRSPAEMRGYKELSSLGWLVGSLNRLGCACGGHLL